MCVCVCFTMGTPTTTTVAAKTTTTTTKTIKRAGFYLVIKFYVIAVLTVRCGSLSVCLALSHSLSLSGSRFLRPGDGGGGQCGRAGSDAFTMRCAARGCCCYWWSTTATIYEDLACMRSHSIATIHTHTHSHSLAYTLTHAHTQTLALACALTVTVRTLKMARRRRV